MGSLSSAAQHSCKTCVFDTLVAAAAVGAREAGGGVPAAVPAAPEITEMQLDLPVVKHQAPLYPIGVPVIIKSHRNKNLQDNTGNVTLNSAELAWEQWVISDVGNGEVLITSHRSKNLQDKHGIAMLSSNAQLWEKWTIRNAGDGKVFITSHRGENLQDNNGDVRLSANEQMWERWSISQVDAELGENPVVHFSMGVRLL